MISEIMYYPDIWLLSLLFVTTTNFKYISALKWYSLRNKWDPLCKIDKLI